MIINCFKITVTGGLGLVLLVFSIIACFNYSSKAQADVERACFGSNTRVILDQKLIGDIDMEDQASIIGDELVSQEYFQMVDKIMCSKICPCPQSSQSLWKGYGDEFLRKYNRTSSYTSLTTDEALDYDENAE